VRGEENMAVRLQEEIFCQTAAHLCLLLLLLKGKELNDLEKTSRYAEFQK
jgi:hypothetical protein